VALVHTNGKLGESSSFKEAYVEHVWEDATKICSKPIMELVIEVMDCSVVEFRIWLFISLRNRELMMIRLLL
jgi:hypothetical protein